MMKPLNIFLVYIFSMIIYGVFDANTQSIILYKEAWTKAKRENKQLMVLGSPYTASGKMITLFTRTYGCGDICIDMNGCGSCQNAISDKIENVLHIFNPYEYVIFESGLLEVVDEKNLNYIVSELYRIAGTNDNIFGRHYIQSHKSYYQYFGKYAYSFLGEGRIQRFVEKYPPNDDYEFRTL